MNRIYGSQSYNPKELTLLFWGNGNNRYTSLCDDKISQNILFACYNDKLTEEQISLEIGVPLPYMEESLIKLLENDLIKKEGNRHYTNILLLTNDLLTEIDAKTVLLQKQIAELLQNAVLLQEQKVRHIGFIGYDMPIQTYRWQAIAFILRKAIVEILQNKLQLDYPKDKYGTECFVWGKEITLKEEDWLTKFGFAVSTVTNKKGDYVQFMDFPINGERVHSYYFNRQPAVNVLLDIANGNTQRFSENDKALAADMIRKGYVTSIENTLQVNAPIFTEAQLQQLTNIFSSTADQIVDKTGTLLETVTKIIKNHIPVHLKEQARNMAYLHLFQDVISSPISILYKNDFLLSQANNTAPLPTTYVVLKHN